MNIWQKIDPWIDRDKYAFTTMAIFIGCLTLFAILRKDSVKSTKDLMQIEGQLTDYSFRTGTRGSKMYYLWLDRYPCTFQIPADYLPCFEKTLFINSSLRNEAIQLKLSKKQGEKLYKQGEYVFINEINANGKLLLMEACTISIEKRNYPYAIAFSFLSLFAGGAFYIYKRRKQKLTIS
jgi:hypothetical protein